MAIRKLTITRFYDTRIDVPVVVAVGGVGVEGALGEGYEVLSALFLQLLRSLSLFLNKELKCIARVSQVTVRLDSAATPAPAPLGLPGPQQGPGCS